MPVLPLMLIVLVVACGGQGGATKQADHSPEPETSRPLSTTPASVNVTMFGDVPIADGAIHLMDGGIDGIQGHTLVIPASGDALWERRRDSMQPSGTAGSGQLALSPSEAKQLRRWADGLWDLARNGAARFHMKDGPARWVWAIVLRRGDEVRVLSGGNMSPSDGAPEPAKSALAWLIERVDVAAGASP